MESEKFCFSKSKLLLGLLLVLIILITLLASKLSNNKISNKSEAAFKKRTVRTTAVNSDKWPFTVMIFRKQPIIGLNSNIMKSAVCAGFLISKDWVVTAAHCLYKNSNEFVTEKNKTDLGIAIGYRELDKKTANEILSDIDQIVVHEGFDFNKYFKKTLPKTVLYNRRNNDIALLKLKTPVPNTNTIVKSISLTKDTSLILPGTSVVLTGYGGPIYAPVNDRLREDKAQITRNIQVVDSKIFHFIEIDPITSGTNVFYTDTSISNSGSPLLAFKNGRWYAIGVLSGEEGTFVSQYVNIALQASWIKMVTNIDVNQGTF